MWARFASLCSGHQPPPLQRGREGCSKKPPHTSTMWLGAPRILLRLQNAVNGTMNQKLVLTSHNPILSHNSTCQCCHSLSATTIDFHFHSFSPRHVLPLPPPPCTSSVLLLLLPLLLVCSSSSSCCCCCYRRRCRSRHPHPLRNHPVALSTRIRCCGRHCLVPHLKPFQRLPPCIALAARWCNHLLAILVASRLCGCAQDSRSPTFSCCEYPSHLGCSHCRLSWQPHLPTTCAPFKFVCPSFVRVGIRSA